MSSIKLRTSPNTHATHTKKKNQQKKHELERIEQRMGRKSDKKEMFLFTINKSFKAIIASSHELTIVEVVPFILAADET